VQFLNDFSEVKHEAKGGDIELVLPKNKPPYEIPVVDLYLK
jgi:alpha-L-fucosidase